MDPTRIDENAYQSRLDEEERMDRLRYRYVQERMNHYIGREYIDEVVDRVINGKWPADDSVTKLSAATFYGHLSAIVTGSATAAQVREQLRFTAENMAIEDADGPLFNQWLARLEEDAAAESAEAWT